MANALMIATRAAPSLTLVRVYLAVFTSLLSFALARDSPPAVAEAWDSNTWLTACKRH